MELTAFDLTAFVAFVAAVIGVSLYASRKEESSEDYFLAGRRLNWWLIGFSLIASNISTEHFVGMAGEGFELGLAIASYEWIAAITLVFVALFLLPKFLRSGIFTIPEYLEYRYNAAARAIMAGYMLVAYVIVAIAAVLYSGALALNAIFGIGMLQSVWLIGIIAGVYTIYGGLEAVVWSDLLQGAALLAGGALVAILGLKAVGGMEAFLRANAGKLHTVLPADHPKMPWTILIGGIWIPNIFYWGLNQFITQRTLGAKSLAEGQRGILFAAAIKLLIPFIIIFPGIMAFQLYGAEISQADQAYPHIIKNILPAGLRGIMFAALFGAVMSSLDSMLNSAASIFTIDLYQRHWKTKATAPHLVKVGRIMTGVFVVVGCLWAPALSHFGGIFNYMQMVWGFISPGVVTVFLLGLLLRKAPPAAAVGALLLTIPVYGLLLFFMPGAFLNAMGATFLILAGFMGIVTLLKPLPAPKAMPEFKAIDLHSSPRAKTSGLAIIVATVALYVIFW